MTEFGETRPIEEELLSDAKQIKRALAVAALIFTPTVSLLVWYFEFPHWWAIAGALILAELGAYSYITRAVNRNVQQKIAKMRSSRKLASDRQMTRGHELTAR